MFALSQCTTGALHITECFIAVGSRVCGEQAHRRDRIFVRPRVSTDNINQSPVEALCGFILDVDVSAIEIQEGREYFLTKIGLAEGFGPSW